jgi:hypothetical protein
VLIAGLAIKVSANDNLCFKNYIVFSEVWQQTHKGHWPVL